MITSDTFRLDGKRALITGSSSGIGLALARGLAQAGAEIVLNARNAAKLADAAQALTAEGHTVHNCAFEWPAKVVSKCSPRAWRLIGGR